MLYKCDQLNSSKKRGIYVLYQMIQAPLVTHLNTYFINICSRDKRICYCWNLNRYLFKPSDYKCKSRHTCFCVCHYVCHCHTTSDVSNKSFSKAKMDVVFNRNFHRPKCIVCNFDELHHAPGTSNFDGNCNRRINLSSHDCCK